MTERVDRRRFITSFIVGVVAGTSINYFLDNKLHLFQRTEYLNFEKEEDVNKVLKIAEKFPVVEFPISLPNSSFYKNFNPDSREFGDLKKKIGLIGVIIGNNEENSSRNLQFTMIFEKGIKLDPQAIERIRTRIYEPAFAVSSANNQNRVFQPYALDVYTDSNNKEDVTGETNSLTIEFPIPIDDLVSTELVFVLKEGLMVGQPKGVIFIPFRFKPLPATSGPI